jgi:hypothetical protein
MLRAVSAPSKASKQGTKKGAKNKAIRHQDNHGLRPFEKPY